jgi:diguanylate cyclase (GGDEF)-like protein
MDTAAFYIGSDQQFGQSLSKSAQILKIPCQIVPPQEINTHFLPPDHGIFFFDSRNAIENDLFEKFDLLPPSRIKISILVADENDLNSIYNNTLQTIHFDDILSRSLNPDILSKKIALYCDCLLARLNTDDDSRLHRLLKKNLDLNNQIATLQQSLNHVDSNLKVQEHVIDKINQISHLSHQINCLDIHRIASVCVEKIPHLAGARFASLYALDSESRILCLLRHNHPYAIEKQIFLDDRPNSPMAVAIRQKNLLIIEDISQWAITQKQNLNRPFNRNYHSNSCIVAPLLSGGDIIGVLNLADKIDSPAFDAVNDLAPVRLLCEIIGSAMSNIKLYEAVQKQAQTDSLTGLLNHRTFYLSLARETQRANRYGSSLSLLMIDMDNLKHINDYFGHQTGDSALLCVAETISQCIRETDAASRYGGDEFAVILPNTSLSDALIVANRLVHSIDCRRVAANNQHIPITISVGLSPYQPGQSTEEFARQADNALLEAKKSGKNRIHVAETVSQ